MAHVAFIELQGGKQKTVMTLLNISNLLKGEETIETVLVVFFCVSWVTEINT